MCFQTGRKTMTVETSDFAWYIKEFIVIGPVPVHLIRYYTESSGHYFGGPGISQCLG